MLTTVLLLYMTIGTTIAASEASFEKCLPPDIRPTDVVSAEFIRKGPDGSHVKKVTVRDKLIELKARCKRGALVDQKGREIRFYRLKGCWGNPPADYQETLADQEKELQELRKRYTVIEMTCNPSGTPPQMIS